MSCEPKLNETDSLSVSLSAVNPKVWSTAPHAKRGLPGGTRTGVASAHLALSSGLKWESAGTAKPTKGTELNNEKLADALVSKLEFTNKEWDKFEISGLRKDHFIKSGDMYFKPSEKESRSSNTRVGSVVGSALNRVHMEPKQDELFDNQAYNVQADLSLLIDEHFSNLRKQCEQTLQPSP